MRKSSETLVFLVTKEKHVQGLKREQCDNHKFELCLASVARNCLKNQRERRVDFVEQVQEQDSGYYRCDLSLILHFQMIFVTVCLFKS